MAAKAWSEDELAMELRAEERLRGIDWTHPALAKLSDAARLIYAALIDGCSEEARETIIGVDLVWRNRERYAVAPLTTEDRKTVLETICDAVHELTDNGLLLLLDETTIQGGWVRRPWDELPS